MAFFVHPAYADFIGARVSGGMFKYSVSGSVRDDASPVNTINVKNDLNWKDDSGVMGYLYIEHPFPIIPNVRLGTTSLKVGGTGTVTANYTFNGVNYTANDTVVSDVDFSHTELALYYEVIDTGFDLDVGLNFKFFDGKIRLEDKTNPAVSTSTIKETVPMLYGAVSVPIPGTGVKVMGDLSTVSYKDSTYTDYLVRLHYDTSFMLGVELGYRSIHIDYQDTGANKYAKLDMKGPYLAATLSF